MLPQGERLKLNGLFQQAYQRGRSLGSKNFKINFTRSLQEFESRMPLVGFVVAKTFSKSAVVRNRIKRKLREIYRLYRLKSTNSPKLKKLGLLVIGIKKDFALNDYQSMKVELENLLDKVTS